MRSIRKNKNLLDKPPAFVHLNHDSNLNSASPYSSKNSREKSSTQSTFRRQYTPNLVRQMPPTLSPISTITHRTKSRNFILQPSLTTRRSNRKTKKKIKFSEVVKAKNPVCLVKEPSPHQISMLPDEIENFCQKKNIFKEREKSPSNIWERKLRERGLEYPLKKILERSYTPKKGLRVDRETLKKRYGKNGTKSRSISRGIDTSYLTKHKKKNKKEKKYDLKGKNKKCVVNFVKEKKFGKKINLTQAKKKDQFSYRHERREEVEFRRREIELKTVELKQKFFKAKEKFESKAKNEKKHFESKLLKVEKYVFKPDRPEDNINTLSGVSPQEIFSSIFLDESSFRLSQNEGK